MLNRAVGLLTALGVAGVGLIGASQAQATVILQGDSNSSYFDSCAGTGCSSGSANTITLGSTASGGSASTLSVVPVNISASGATSGLELGALQLVTGNKVGSGEGTLNFDYNFVLSFTVPNGTGSTSVLDLTLAGNGSPGSNGLVTITGLVDPITTSLDLPGGLSLSNFRFADNGSAGSFSGATGTWNVQGQSSDILELLADLSVTQQQQSADPFRNRPPSR